MHKYTKKVNSEFLDEVLKKFYETMRIGRMYSNGLLKFTPCIHELAAFKIFLEDLYEEYTLDKKDRDLLKWCICRIDYMGDTLCKINNSLN